MEDRGEIKEPWRKLTEREPSASGPLLAAYDAVDALEHRVEHQFTILAGAAAELQELQELQAYATSCEERIVELQD